MHYILSQVESGLKTCQSSGWLKIESAEYKTVRDGRIHVQFNHDS
ncbi:hypothetical protein PC116_g4289 [Phytophthora cactorum]|uniref:Uncharacterized protein n=1 Tax=Phytophthora cactorum TaxID=29920 RepID=A0A8T1EJU8_9STRA|nr:hypothetical protein Pcac1_g16623 [Phytophthora cactorum]KAG2926914.1 hypothetical protein PC114_g3665 [Phytophthora cactorum]KAG2951899.1 hypothetical protein PC117_g3233 [Phytophthora cactorum]KAG3033997.1 hypothetical protein PC120_g1625 [Phytophthora cactorum]KAG3038575.1 hypothetical protein PC119_g2805 [Phytophthora cactorum]